MWSQKKYMDVSENRGTPKSSMKNRVFHYFHHPFWEENPPIFGIPTHSKFQQKTLWADHLGSGQPQCAKLEGCEMAVKNDVEKKRGKCCILFLVATTFNESYKIY